MKRRKTWLTKSGIEVRSGGRARFIDRDGKPRWKILGFRVDSGGCHGWLWLRNLREVKP